MKFFTLNKIGIGLLITFFIFVAVYSSFFWKNKLLAQSSGETYFGGLNTVQLVCTCSANILLYVFDYSTNSLLRLVYQPGASMLYMNYNVFGRYLLGSYMPGAGTCQMITGLQCTDMTSDGQLGSLPGTGTSN